MIGLESKTKKSKQYKINSKNQIAFPVGTILTYSSFGFVQETL
jgi:hypothetical protein